MTNNATSHTVGPFTLEPMPDPALCYGGVESFVEVESFFGVDRSCGDALFVTRINPPSYAPDMTLLWSVHLWEGWEDCRRGPQSLGDEPTEPTLAAALATAARMIAARDKRRRAMA